MFTSRLDAPESSPLGLRPGILVGVAPGEVALLQRNGALSRAPLGVGSTRGVLEDIEWADWTADGLPSFAEFSPRIPLSQDRVAFVDRPQSGYSRGLVRVVDLTGKSVAYSEPYDPVQGRAWADDDEVWFTAAVGGEELAIRGLSLSALSRRSREVLRGVGSLVLHDISKDGRLLVTQETLTFETAGLAPREMKERDLTWLDGTFVEDLTPDTTTRRID